jgi:hypothetical protein
MASFVTRFAVEATALELALFASVIPQKFDVGTKLLEAKGKDDTILLDCRDYDEAVQLITLLKGDRRPTPYRQWIVPSHSDPNTTYTITQQYDGSPLECSCPNADPTKGKNKHCKHVMKFLWENPNVNA